VFKTGLLDSEEAGSALDQVGHLTGIVKRITELLDLDESIDRLECTFDGRTDRWYDFRALSSPANRWYRFDERTSLWLPLQ